MAKVGFALATQLPSPPIQLVQVPLVVDVIAAHEQSAGQLVFDSLLSQTPLPHATGAYLFSAITPLEVFMRNFVAVESFVGTRSTPYVVPLFEIFISEEFAVESHANFTIALPSYPRNPQSASAASTIEEKIISPNPSSK